MEAGTSTRDSHSLIVRHLGMSVLLHVDLDLTGFDMCGWLAFMCVSGLSPH